jgi:hypothetical protein
MNHQPGHLFRCPGIDEKVPNEPVHQKEPETRWLDKAAHNTYDAKDHTNLLIQRDEQKIVIPGLATARDLLLL